MPRIITVIIGDDRDYNAICEGDNFVHGLSFDELVGRLNICIVNGSPPPWTEAETLRRDSKHGPYAYSFHPLKHGGQEPKIGDPPVARK